MCSRAYTATLNAPAILILAAGASSRMRGGDKMLEEVDGRPQIARATLAALETNCPVWVALPPDRPARAAALAGLPVTLVEVSDPQSGMSASLRAGLLAIPPALPVLVLLADLPDITSADLALLIAAHQANPELIHRATSAAGQPGHPVLFPSWSRPAISVLTGDQGARDFLRTHAEKVATIPLPGDRAITDLDTPEDWAAWRAARKL